MLKQVPMSIMAPGGSASDNATAYIAVGDDRLRPGFGIKHNMYWIVTYDRRTLEIVGNEFTSNNSKVPESVQRYVGNVNYFIVLVTFNISGDNLPTGDFYDFLVAAGAGTQLGNLEQVFEQLGTGSLNWPSYVLVTTLEKSASPDGIEGHSLTSWSTVMALQLVPITYASGTLYTPVQATQV